LTGAWRGLTGESEGDLFGDGVAERGGGEGRVREAQAAGVQRGQVQQLRRLRERQPGVLRVHERAAELLVGGRAAQRAPPRRRLVFQDGVPLPRGRRRHGRGVPPVVAHQLHIHIQPVVHCQGVQSPF